MKIHGRVVHGSERGRTLGYPTANVAVPEWFEAADGVYAAVVELDGAGEPNVTCGSGGSGGSGIAADCGLRYGAMANLGVKPTFADGGGRILELHLLGFEGDLYGRELTVELIRFIRPERRFASPEELRTQIEKDKLIIENILQHL